MSDPREMVTCGTLWMAYILDLATTAGASACWIDQSSPGVMVVHLPGAGASAKLFIRSALRRDLRLAMWGEDGVMVVWLVA